VTVAAVIFDLDGVLLDSETIWDDARRTLVESEGAIWKPQATSAMMGMSAPEWSAYLHDELGLDTLTPAQISDRVTRTVDERYRAALPLLPGAREVVHRIAEHWSIGLASSSNRTIIERFLDTSGLRRFFGATVSSEEVAHGKPSPDVYLAAAHALHVDPQFCVAIEDSTNGIRSAAAAHTAVVAVPNRRFPLSADSLNVAALVVPTLDALSVDEIARLR
jgi:HAD superfamily hydrolase (TIGR01509 family)